MGHVVFMAEMKNICILGSTGSIGRNTLEVLEHFPADFRVASLSANTNVDLLRQQVARFRPGAVAVLDKDAASLMTQSLNGSTKLFSGEQGLLELVRRDDVDIVVNALVGFAGLAPTIEAIKHGKTVALANKESLVAAGEIVMSLAKKHDATIIPIDSEHSAILQCLAGEQSEDIERLILTASGGPFLHLEQKEFQYQTVEAALRHPNWSMGRKITIDSATMMNKGLEIIEAHWLFGLPPGKIDVLIHPQSIIHSMVEFTDGSIKAQLGVPDMKIPIQYALTYPGRAQSRAPRIDFEKLGSMTFLKPDTGKFLCLRLAYEALRSGGTAPVVLNAANEVAVDLFLNNKIAFTAIPEYIERAMEAIPVISSPSLTNIFEQDQMARQYINEYHRNPTRMSVHANS